MTYLEFREQWHGMGCFNIYQIRAWEPGFDRSNLTRWVKRGYLSKLRQDWYAFSDLKGTPEMARYIAQRIYTPSYISLHYALSFYGIIPEAVTDITCVTSNRTATYHNDFGRFSYQTVKPDLFSDSARYPFRRRAATCWLYPRRPSSTCSTSTRNTTPPRLCWSCASTNGGCGRSWTRPS